MSEIPTWWLVISAAFFLMNILASIGMIVTLIRLQRQVTELKPKVAEVAAKVHEVAVSVESAAKKVDALATGLKGSVANVAGTASALLSKPGSGESQVVKGIEKVMPVLMGAITVVRLVQKLRGAKPAGTPGSGKPSLLDRLLG
jgi:hypothetical protein